MTGRLMPRQTRGFVHTAHDEETFVLTAECRPSLTQLDDRHLEHIVGGAALYSLLPILVFFDDRQDPRFADGD